MKKQDKFPPKEIAQDIAAYVKELALLVEDVCPDHSKSGREALKMMRVRTLLGELEGAAEMLREVLEGAK